MAYLDSAASLEVLPPAFTVKPVVAAFGAVCLSPESGASLPYLAADLRVAASANVQPFVVQWEVSASAAFTAVLWSAEQTGRYNSGSPFSATVTALADKTQFWWRARAGDGNVWGPWAVSSFYVDLSVGALYETSVVLIGPAPPVRSQSAFQSTVALVGPSPVPAGALGESVVVNIGASPSSSGSWHYGYFNDTHGGTPNPYLWWIFPAFARLGDGASLVGSGFGDLQTQYSGIVEAEIDGVWTPVGVVSWQTYPPTAAAYTDARVLSVLSGRIDWHHTDIHVVAAVPMHPEGHLLRVVTDGPDLMIGEPAAGSEEPEPPADRKAGGSP